MIRYVHFGPGRHLLQYVTAVKPLALAWCTEAVRDAISALCGNFHLGQGGSPRRQPGSRPRLLRGCSISGNSPACQIHISFSFSASATKPSHCPSITPSSPLIQTVRWVICRNRKAIHTPTLLWLELYYYNVSHDDNTTENSFLQLSSKGERNLRASSIHNKKDKKHLAVPKYFFQTTRNCSNSGK